MKKTLSLLVIAALLLTALFAFSGCGKKPIDIDDLEDLLEDEDFEVSTYDGEEEGVDVEYLNAYNDDISISFSVLDEDDKDTEELIEESNEELEDMIDEIEDEDIDDLKFITKTIGKDYSCIEVASDEEDTYLFVARVKNTAITCSCDYNDMEDAQKLMKKIGYK